MVLFPERDTNPCASMPCMNGGSCENDGATRYYCFCHPLVGGDDCEVGKNQIALALSSL